MMRSLPELQKPVWHSEDSVKNVWERNGIKLDTKLKVYKAVVLPTLFVCMCDLDSSPTSYKGLNHFHSSCLRQLLKNQVARQDSRHRGPEEIRDAKHAVLKLAQLRWTDHVIRMPDERLPKKVYMENYKRESALKAAR